MGVPVGVPRPAPHSCKLQLTIVTRRGAKEISFELPMLRTDLKRTAECLVPWDGPDIPIIDCIADAPEPPESTNSCPQPKPAVLDSVVPRSYSKPVNQKAAEQMEHVQSQSTVEVVI